jgi:hypothetical protein
MGPARRHVRATGAINRISHQGKLYLAAGGFGDIIGDGQLPNAGSERCRINHSVLTEI